MSVRLKRLYAEFIKVAHAFNGHPQIHIKEATGDPPEKYLVEYRVKGLDQEGETVVLKGHHLVEINLPLHYPTVEPYCRMLTTVFHPNIDRQVICIADYWTAGEPLVDLIIRIGQMLTYQNYNIKSPRNGEAARWADGNRARFPLERITLGVDPGSIEVVLTPEEIALAWSLLKGGPPVPAPAGEELVCANCQQSSATIPVHRCVNGHLACEDCLVRCSQCAKNLCVRCDLQKCAICGEIICRDCQGLCPACRVVVCQKHLAACEDCGVGGCSQCLTACRSCGKKLCQTHAQVLSDHRISCRDCLVHCEICGDDLPHDRGVIHQCPRCGRYVCTGHYQEGKQLCVECAQRYEQKITLTYDDLAAPRPQAPPVTPPPLPPPLPARPAAGPRFCSRCGQAIPSPDSRFCSTCGQKLSA